MKNLGLFACLFLTFVLVVARQPILAAVVFFASVPSWFFHKRFGVETQGPFCLWRTKHGLKILDRLAKYRSAWLAFADAGVIFAFGIPGAVWLYLQSKRTSKDKARVLAMYCVFAVASIAITMPNAFLRGLGGSYEFATVLLLTGIGGFVFYALGLNTLTIIQNYFVGVQPAPGVAPIIPGVQIEGSPLFFPVHALLGLVVLLIVHELSHGVVSRVQRIRVKSMGLMTSGVFPIGAFAEPDDKEVRRSPPLKRVRVFAAGSMANFATGFLFLALFLTAQAVVQPHFVQDPHSIQPAVFIPLGQPYVTHLEVLGVINGTPAYDAGIANGTRIYNVEVMFSDKTPGKTETLVTSNGTLTLQRNASGSLGVLYQLVKNESAYTPGVWASKYTIESLFWIFALNFIVGMINFLPFLAFDGAHIFRDVAARWTGQKNAKKILTFIYFVIGFLLALNALPYFLKV